MRAQNIFLFLVMIALSSAIALTLVDAEPFPLSKEQANKIEQQYGSRALKRIDEWKRLMKSNMDDSEVEKLKLVNSFFNKRKFSNDQNVWRVEDYWATPIEFLSKNAGDCEDYSIAKYFTLIEMGIPEKKLRITYVRALKFNEAHMVLTYSENPGDVPLVLDNLIGRIKKASRRKDLRPVYSFNGGGLWMAKERGKGKKGSENRLPRWSDLIERMT